MKAAVTPSIGRPAAASRRSTPTPASIRNTRLSHDHCGRRSPRIGRWPGRAGTEHHDHGTLPCAGRGDLSGAHDGILTQKRGQEDHGGAQSVYHGSSFVCPAGAVGLVLGGEQPHAHAPSMHAQHPHHTQGCMLGRFGGVPERAQYRVSLPFLEIDRHPAR